MLKLRSIPRRNGTWRSRERVLTKSAEFSLAAVFIFLRRRSLCRAGSAAAITNSQLLRNAQQPQVIVLQQAPPLSTALSNLRRLGGLPLALPDAGQFTLVLHDGKQIEAVAFTRMKDKIVYIAVDGSRRTIALSELDADATIRVNQERGTPLQLPL